MSKLIPKNDIKISFIGAGKVAFSLVPALLDKNYKISSVFDIHKESAAELAVKFNIKTYSDALFNLDAANNVIVISVPDSDIKTVAGLLALLELDFANTIFIHLSGSRNVRVLDALKNKGAYTASLHPMQTFPSRKKYSIKGTYLAVESENPGVRELLSELAEDLELVPFTVKTEEKIFYHLMGVFASNFFVANIYGAETANELMSDEMPDMYKLLKPIINATFSNIAKTGSVEALSGPIERGDFETIELHVNALSGNHELLVHYLANSLTLLEVANIKGKLDPRQYNRMKLYLGSKLKEVSAHF